MVACSCRCQVPLVGFGLEGGTVNRKKRRLVGIEPKGVFSSHENWNDVTEKLKV